MAFLHLAPDPAQLTGFAQVCFAMVVLALAGRAILAGRGGIAVQTMAGWGALCIALTLWGVLLPLSLRIPAAAFALLALAGLAWRNDRAGLADLGRLLAVALPLLWVMADIAPSQPDALLAFIPKSAYLVDHGAFPTQAGPEVYTDVPVAPYSIEMVSLLGSLAGGGYAANGPALFTLMLHLVAGLLLARVLAGAGRLGWSHAAGGLALATLLNPGFVARVDFAGYGEAPLAVSLLFAVWLTAGVLDDLARGIRWPAALLPLALVLAALIGIKQQAAALVAAYGAGVAVAVLHDRTIGQRTAAQAFGAALLPAVVVYAFWRGYVATAFPAGELKALPVSAWAWDALPRILRDMGLVVVHKPPIFAAIAAVLLLLARPPQALTLRTRRVLTIVAIAFAAYDAFLVLTFVGHFRGEHSFARYNSHLALAVVLGLVLAARDVLVAHPQQWPAARRWAGRVAVAVMLAAPVAAQPLLRFDRDMPEPLMRLLARQLAAEASGNEAVAVILPGDNGTAAEQLNAVLRYAPPRRPGLALTFSPDPAANSLAQALAIGTHTALLSCTDGSGLDLPGNAAALLRWSDGAWRAARVWPYPPLPPRRWWNWTGMLAGEPFCIR